MTLKFWFMALISLAPLAALANKPSDDNLTLERLMGALSRVESIDAAFREVKEVELLNEPVILTGILRYRAPDYVLKQVILPRREGVEIDGDELTIDSPEHGHHRLRLSDYPAIGAFVESFRGTLAGDLASLKRYYRVRLDGSFDDWTLHLKPVDRSMAEYVEGIVITGSQARVLRIDTLQAKGGRDVMTITPSNQ